MQDTTSQLFAYFYFMDDTPEAMGQDAVPNHVQYWHELDLDGYQGGPFGDYSGGMILFNAADQNQAMKLVSQDPFVLRGLIGKSWLKPWLVK